MEKSKYHFKIDADYDTHRTILSECTSSSESEGEDDDYPASEVNDEYLPSSEGEDCRNEPLLDLEVIGEWMMNRDEKFTIKRDQEKVFECLKYIYRGVGNDQEIVSSAKVTDDDMSLTADLEYASTFGKVYRWKASKLMKYGRLIADDDGFGNELFLKLCSCRKQHMLYISSYYLSPFMTIGARYANRVGEDHKGAPLLPSSLKFQFNKKFSTMKLKDFYKKVDAKRILIQKTPQKKQ